MRMRTALIAISAITCLTLAVLGGWYLWPKGDAGSPTETSSIASELAELMRDQVWLVDSVSTAGSTVTVLDGQITLSVVQPTVPAKERGATGHVHVIAQTYAPRTSQLEACIVSIGRDRSDELTKLAVRYVRLAWPAVVSMLKGEPLLDAYPFYGTEPDGIEGYRGYAGPVYKVESVGERSEDPFADVSLLSGISGVPFDGRVHLVKVIVYPHDDAWMRIVELDGNIGDPLSHQRWTAVPPSKSIGCGSPWFTSALVIVSAKVRTPDLGPRIFPVG